MAFPGVPEVFPPTTALRNLGNALLSPITWPASACVWPARAIARTDIVQDFRADPIYETRYHAGRAGAATKSALNPVNWLKNLMTKAPALGVLLGVGAGAGIYSHFAEPKMTSLPEADAEALSAAQAQAQRDFLERTPAMADPRIAPMQAAMALQAQLGGPTTGVDAGTIAGSQRVVSQQQMLGA